MLRARCAAGAPDIAPWDDFAVGLAGSRGDPLAGPGRQARFERFEEIAGILEDAASETPLVVLLARLHEAGRGGLLFLEWLARFLPDCPLAIIGTYEPVAASDHPLAETLAELAHEPVCERLALSGALDRPPAAGPAQAVFRLVGDYWTIAFERRVVRLRDTKGLRYLAPLLHRPGHRVHVLELLATAMGRRPPARPDLEDKTRAERARVAVTKALKTALERIAAAHPPLGEHLSRTVRRGYFCTYVPDPRRPIGWRG